MFGVFAAGMGLGQAFNFIGAQQAAAASNAAINAQNNANLLGAWSQGQTNALNERLTREAWAREDKAVQRRVADLKAAGLSPVLAAGSAAQSSGPIPMGAFRPESAGNLKMQKAQMTMQMLQNVAQTITGTVGAYHQVRMAAAEATTAEAKSALAEAFAKAELEDLRQRTSESKGRQAHTAQETLRSKEETRKSKTEADYQEKHKFRMSEGSHLGREVQGIARILMHEDSILNEMWDNMTKSIEEEKKQFQQEQSGDAEHQKYLEDLREKIQRDREEYIRKQQEWRERRRRSGK